MRKIRRSVDQISPRLFRGLTRNQRTTQITGLRIKQTNKETTQIMYQIIRLISQRTTRTPRQQIIRQRMVKIPLKTE